MIEHNFKTILELLQVFPDEQACIDHLEALRWPNGIITSPFNPTSKVYKCANNRYRCKETGKYFNVKTGALFDNTKVKLQKWLLAIWLVTSHKKDISSVQLCKDISVTQKTAWFMLQRIRSCYELDNGDHDANKPETRKASYIGKRGHKDPHITSTQVCVIQKTSLTAKTENPRKRIKEIRPFVGNFILRYSMYKNNEIRLSIPFFINRMKQFKCQGLINV